MTISLQKLKARLLAISKVKAEYDALAPEFEISSAKAISEHSDTNEWQVSDIKCAIASLDRGEGIPHKSVEDWVTCWGSTAEKPAPKRR